MRIKLAALVLLVLVLISGALVGAQDDTTFCGDLSAEDCEFLTAAQDPGMAAESAAFELALDVEVSGAERESSNFALSVNADGAFSGAGALAATAGEEMDADAAAAALQSFAGELNLTIELPMQAAMMTGGESSLELNLVLVDGVGYINFDTIAPLLEPFMEEDAPELAGWGGLNLVEVAAAQGGGDPADLGTTLEGLTGQDVEGLTSTFDPERFGESVTVTRLDDAEVDGVAVRVYEFSVDLSAVFADEAVRESTIEQMMEQEDLSQEEAEELLSGLEAAFEEGTMVFTTSYGEEDMLVRNVTFTLELDLAAFSALSGSVNADADENPGVLTIDFALTYTNVNGDQGISAPEGAVIVPTEEFLGMMGGMMGGGMPR